MRIDVSKFLFVGAYSDKDAFLKKAQEVGFVEFIHPRGEKLTPVPVEAERYAQAIKCLRGYVPLEQEKRHDLQLAEEICHEVLQAKQLKESSLEQIDALQVEIHRIQPYGNFSQLTLRDIDAQTGRKVRFYCAKTSKAVDLKDESLILINSLDGIDYFVSIEHEPVAMPDLIEMQITQELQALYQQKKDLRQAVHDCDEKLKGLTRYSWMLHYAFYKKMGF